MPAGVTHRLAWALEWMLWPTLTHVSLADLKVVTATIDVTDWNTRIMVITLGVAAIGSKLLEIALNAYQRYRTIDKESDHGKLAVCLEEFQAFRAKAHDELVAERATRAAEIDRLKRDREDQCRDYEERILNKRQEIEYLHGQINALHAADTQKMLMIESLNATLVQQAAAMTHVASRAAESTRESVRNTGKAIEKIGQVADVHAPHPPEVLPGMAVIMAPAERVDVIVQESGPAAEQAAAGPAEAAP